MEEAYITLIKRKKAIPKTKRFSLQIGGEVVLSPNIPIFNSPTQGGKVRGGKRLSTIYIFFLSTLLLLSLLNLLLVLLPTIERVLGERERRII